jgi:hypothetical protein
MENAQLEAWQAGVTRRLVTLEAKQRNIQKILLALHPDLKPDLREPDSAYIRYLKVMHVNKLIEAGERTASACSHADISRSMYDRYKGIVAREGDLGLLRFFKGSKKK